MQTPRTRVQRRPVHGVLLLDKPLGMSSNQALQKAKWLLRADKAGHTGTLDPLATGVLPLCFGAATKFSQLHLDADKAYLARLQLGVTTSTGDAEGEVLARRPVDVTAAQIDAAVARFRGVIEQIPPMYSALKKDGKALYEYARAGQEVERNSRHVQIDELDWSFDEPGQPREAPESEAKSVLNLSVKCSKGTYIRTLGEDIGEALGCGGHLTLLRRVQTGPFGLANCVTLAQLEQMDEAQRMARLAPVDILLPTHWPLTLTAPEAARFLSGLRRRGDWGDRSAVAVRSEDGSLLGTGHVTAGELIPDRLLNPLEIHQIRDQGRGTQTH